MLSILSKECRYLLLAVGFFTRIPVPAVANFEEQELNHAARYFPLVGVLVGLVGAAVFIASASIFPQQIAVLFSMAATVYVTGAFHEDGFADSVDGLGGGWSKEQILTIMQDSRLGTYGALALFMMLFAKFQVLNAMPAAHIACILVAAHALSRLCSVYVMATLAYAKTSGKAKPLASQVTRRDLVVATVWGLLPILFMSNHLYPHIESMRALLILTLSWLLSVSLVWFWWRNKIRRWLGGYTGDCLGAIQQMTELAFYLGVLAYFGFASQAGGL